MSYLKDKAKSATALCKKERGSTQRATELGTVKGGGAAASSSSMSVKHPIKLGGCLLLAALAAACATPLPPTQSARGPSLPDAGPSQEYKVNFPDLGRGKARYIQLTLGEGVEANCNRLNAQHFEFDSSDPLPQDKVLLQALAECLNDPTNVEHDLMIRGSTDERGSSAYNQALGLRRAERVKEILVMSGVSERRIQTSSGGESGALGDDVRYSHGYDRRVDVRFLGVVHAPR